MSINIFYGTFFLILYCTPICLVESLCLTKSPSSSSDLRTLSISLFSFCLTFPSTSIILVRGPLVYPLISGNICQPKMEPSLRQYTPNRVCYVVYRATGSSRNNPTDPPPSNSHTMQRKMLLVILPWSIKYELQRPISELKSLNLRPMTCLNFSLKNIFAVDRLDFLNWYMGIKRCSLKRKN